MQFEQTLIKYGNSVALTIPTKLCEVIPGAEAGQKVLIDVFRDRGRQILRLSWPIPVEEEKLPAEIDSGEIA